MSMKLMSVNICIACFLSHGFSLQQSPDAAWVFLLHSSISDFVAGGHHTSTSNFNMSLPRCFEQVPEELFLESNTTMQ